MIRPVGNKNALEREVGADGLRDWSYGLLDCCAVPRLCTTTNSIGPSLRVLFFLKPCFFQVAGPRFVLASSTARTSSDYAICITVTVLSLVEVTTSISTAVLTVAWPCLASIGSFRYVGMVWTVTGPCFTRRSDGKPGRYPQSLRYSWGQRRGLPQLVVLSLVCARAGTSGDRAGGEEFFVRIYQLRLRMHWMTTRLYPPLPVFCYMIPTLLSYLPQSSVLVDGVEQPWVGNAF